MWSGGTARLPRFRNQAEEISGSVSSSARSSRGLMPLVYYRIFGGIGSGSASGLFVRFGRRAADPCRAFFPVCSSYDLIYVGAVGNGGTAARGDSGRH